MAVYRDNHCDTCQAYEYNLKHLPHDLYNYNVCRGCRLARACDTFVNPVIYRVLGMPGLPQRSSDPAKDMRIQVPEYVKSLHNMEHTSKSTHTNHQHLTRRIAKECICLACRLSASNRCGRIDMCTECCRLSALLLVAC